MLMNSLCKHNSNPVPASQMAQADYLATRPSMFAWLNVSINHDFFILNWVEDVRTPRYGCRKRLVLKA